MSNECRALQPSPNFQDILLQDLRHPRCVKRHGRYISAIQTDVIVNHGPAKYHLPILTEIRNTCMCSIDSTAPLILPYSLDVRTLVVVGHNSTNTLLNRTANERPKLVPTARSGRSDATIHSPRPPINRLRRMLSRKSYLI